MKIKEVNAFIGKSTAEMVKKILEAMPDDEVITTTELARKIGKGGNAFTKVRNELAGYNLKTSRCVYYGNKKAIVMLSKHLSIPLKTTE